MKTLVTGGAGFIGSNIVYELLGRGHEVVILDNLSSGYERNLPRNGRLRFICGDIRDARIVARAVEGVEAVFHLAASVGNKRSIDNALLDAEVNVIGTLTVLEASRAAGVKKVIASSSAGIFGQLRHLPIREDHPAEPDSPYGASKLCAEKQCLVYSKLYGMEVVCLRYFNVYGPNQRMDPYGNVIPIFAFAMLRDEQITVFGDGEQTRDFIHVRDVVQANLKALEARGVSGAFNIGSGTSVTINRLVELLSQAGGLNPRVRYGDPRPGDVRDSIADIGAARSAFGFEPEMALPDGLRNYLNWAAEEERESIWRKSSCSAAKAC